MNNKIKYVLFALLAVAVLGSCDKNSDEGGVSIPSGSSLQAVSPVTIGMATDYDVLDASLYLQTAVANASQTTFSYAMTHGAIVLEDGSLMFAAPDEQYAAVTAKGLKVWGRTLCWYQNQNATYMDPLVGKVTMSNLLLNPDFEDWEDDKAVGWDFANGITNGYAIFTQETDAGNVQSGSSSVAIEILNKSSDRWRVQILSPAIPTVVGHEYKVTFWAKASGGGGDVQYEWDHGKTGGNPKYNYKSLSTDWTQYTCEFGDGGADPLKATVPMTTIGFDLANNPVGTTIYIDNIVVIDLTELNEIMDATGSPEKRAALVDAALQDWINGVVTHYKGKVTGWDVVNELFADDGSIRTNTNTSPDGHSDWFVWSEYLGENTGVAAFNYAHAADPNALLFINENGLESNLKKLDALIAYVQWLQQQGVHVDGIGTAMHVSISTPKAGIDYMFQKLAATGLKIRISEMDVQVNANSIYDFVLTPQVLAFQSTTYHDVVSSYLQYVPAAQRQDITVWGVNDANSRLYNSGTDFPLLFDNDYAPKPAYGGFLQALKGQ